MRAQRLQAITAKAALLATAAPEQSPEGEAEGDDGAADDGGDEAAEVADTEGGDDVRAFQPNTRFLGRTVDGNVRTNARKTDENEIAAGRASVGLSAAIGIRPAMRRAAAASTLPGARSAIVNAVLAQRKTHCTARRGPLLSCVPARPVHPVPVEMAREPRTHSSFAHLVSP